MTCAGICKRRTDSGKPLVVREDDHLTFLRHRGEHACQTINLARVHRLNRIVDHDEPERRLREQHPRQKQGGCERVDLPLAHHAEGLAAGSVDADVKREVARVAAPSSRSRSSVTLLFCLSDAQTSAARCAIG